VISTPISASREKEFTSAKKKTEGAWTERRAISYYANSHGRKRTNKIKSYEKKYGVVSEKPHKGGELQAKKKEGSDEGVAGANN